MPGKLSAEGAFLVRGAGLANGSVLSVGPRRKPRNPQSPLTSVWPMPGATLDLDFVNDRGYIYGRGQCDIASLVPVSRASTGWVTNSSGLIAPVAANTWRRDFDPITLACKGMLVEEQRTNLLLNSAALATQSVTVAAAAHTLSFYGTGTVTLSGAAAGSIVGDGAFPTRKTFTFTPSAGTLTLTVSGTVQYGQLEPGSFATSYITTTGAQATRAADVATISQLAPWFNASEGTFLFEVITAPINNIVQAVAEVSDGTFNNRFYSRRNASGVPVFATIVGGVTQSDLGSGAIAGGGVVKFANAYKASDFATSSNGAEVLASSSGALPAVNRIYLGTNKDGGASLNGHIKRSVYMPHRHADQVLRGIGA